ncbi:MAG: GNAT family N-acetyltransferase [Bacteroidetes bacterium]|nr:GNAT family N-acetyltransferase [Bacteroidota bacterium]MBU1578063.1 GNAT family N-acetyltransferase [Bacteroidota bacterium]MBU2466427.1 GNAT family N-acetyltransferase [Bacteroidota bacterium]MBU2556863.1 GNAT family N-acetyltransferase [Bacteroidota bacterium]
MIDHLIWDSAFFGFPVGKILIENPFDFHEDEFKSAANSFRLVYVFSGKPIIGASFARLVDVKLTFQKALNASTTSKKLIFFDKKIHDKKALLQLAWESGSYSRFKTDLHFDRKDYFRMYEIWVNKSLTSEQSFVMIEAVNNELLGFVTVDLNDSESASIGLIAVDESCRGQGVGSNLMKQAECLAVQYGRKFLKVATQQENVLAAAFYNKKGYKVANQEYIYHFWNL